MTQTSIAQLSRSRYTSKAFDPTRRIPDAAIAEIEILLRNAPSSVNSQPWHFFIAGTEEGKARVAQAAQGAFAYNEAKILKASHVVVFAVRQDIDEAHLAAILAQEEKDGRFATAEAKAGQQKSRGFYANYHRSEAKDARQWMEKQVYLALGTLLLGAAALDIDACPMEGIDTAALDTALDLPAQGLASLVAVALGYHGEDDFNAKLPKSRLPAERVITRL